MSTKISALDERLQIDINGEEFFPIIDGTVGAYHTYKIKLDSLFASDQGFEKVTNLVVTGAALPDRQTVADDNEKFTLIIIGGSQGAQIFDKILHQSIIKVSKIKSLKVIHQTNQKNIGVLKNLYLENKIDSSVFSFDQNLNLLIDQADLCITRAGASSLAEISFSRKPFIAIPLPSSKDNHQLENANYYKNKGCCWVVDQINFDKIKFEDLLLNILNNKNEILLKKNNLEKLNYQNTWNNVNQNLLNIINEN